MTRCCIGIAAGLLTAFSALPTSAAPQEATPGTNAPAGRDPVVLKYDAKDRLLSWCREHDGVIIDTSCKPKNPPPFFKGGDVITVSVVNPPLLSTFSVVAEKLIVVQPVLPFIRGASDVPEAQAPKPADDAQKAAPPPVAILAEVQSNLSALRKGDQDALLSVRDSLSSALESARQKQRAVTRAATGLTQESTRLAGPTTSGAGSYPEPTYEGIKAFADKVDTRWRTLESGSGPLGTPVFVGALNETDQLFGGIRDLNVASTRLQQAFSAARDEVSGTRSALESIRLSVDATRKNWNALVTPPLGGSDNGNGRNAAPPRRHVDAALADIDAIAAEAVRLDKEPEPVWSAFLQSLTTLDTKAGEINTVVSRLIARGNSVHVNRPAAESQRIVVGQYQQSIAARVEIREHAGFTSYRLAEAPVAQDTQRPLPPGLGGSGPQDAEKPQTPSQAKNGSGNEAPEPRTVYAFPVEVHQIARGNFVSGFARSRLRTREFALKQVPDLDAAGQPKVDKDNAPVMVKMPTLARDDASQNVYYVGLNLYLWPRDLFPKAMPGGAYAVPGVMFAYGVNEEANFLVGANWELPFGLNLGAGRHFGKETQLATGFSTTEALPKDTSAVPTVNRFTNQWYINVGFDASIFKKIFGAAKGVKSGS